MKALREFSFDKDANQPVSVSNVVDPSAALTDPADEDFKPQNEIELLSAIQRLVKSSKLSPEEAYDAVTQAFTNSEENMKKVEEAIRAQIKEILREATKGTGQVSHKVKFNPRVSPEYRPGGAGEEGARWARDVQKLRSKLFKMKFDDMPKVAVTANLMGEFTAKDIDVILTAAGEEVPSNQTVMTDRALAAAKARATVEEFVKKDEYGPSLLADFIREEFPALKDEADEVEHLGEIDDLEMTNIEELFSLMALEKIKSKISEKDLDKISDSLFETPSERDEEYADRKVQTLVTSDEFKNWFEDKAFEGKGALAAKLLDHLFSLAQENPTAAVVYEDEEERFNYLGHNLRQLFRQYQQKVSDMLRPAYKRQGADAASDDAWDMFKNAMNAITGQFQAYVTGSKDEPLEITPKGRMMR